MILSPSRAPEVVRWRWACYFILRELFPTLSKNSCARILKRHRATLVHAERTQRKWSDEVAPKIEAIKAVLG